MPYLQSVNKIKCSNTVIVVTRFMVMAYKILIAWTNLLPPINSEQKSVLEPSSGLQNCFVSEAAGIDPAGAAGLDCLVLLIWLLLFAVFSPLHSQQN